MPKTFAVGYQQSERGEEPFVDIVSDYADHIAEIYFPWVGAASGRAALGARRGYVDWDSQKRLEDDLRTFREMGIGLDILFNANCYGARAVSQHLQNEVGSILEHLEDTVGGVDAVTTTSLAVAHVVKTHFPRVDVRASVNMRIGTTAAMGYVGHLFDSFYLGRDTQRNVEHVRRVRAWCDEHGKKLCMLANSGCLRHCPGQTFHDNLVAHDAEIDESIRIPGFTPHVCWNLYRDRANWPAILEATWVRPEDLHRLEAYFDVIKLATRMHSNPRMVLEAYTARRWRGNLLDLLEPGFSPAFAPYVIDNDRFPPDWFDRAARCAADPTRCDACREVLEEVLVKAE